LEFNDINNDRRVDIVTVNRASRTLSIHLQGQGGGYESPILLDNPDISGDRFAFGDLDADGDTDIAVCSQFSDCILLFFQDQGFSPDNFDVWSVPEMDSPEYICVPDLNGDGAPDLVVANKASDNVLVSLQGPQGFTEPVILTHPLLGSVGGMEARDIDGDRLLDIVVSDQGSDSFLIFYQVLPGLIATDEFVTGDAGEALVSLSVEDLDGDGDQDLRSGLSLFSNQQ
jgi:hypothetical protein